MSAPQDIPEDEALAAEYVLRLLEPEAERAFAARLDREPALLELVRFWEAEFAPLADTQPDVPPPPALRKAVLEQVAGEPAPRKRMWVFGWLALPSLLALAVAAFLVVGPTLREPVFDPAFHASLASEDGAVRIEAGYAPDGMLFKVIREAGAPATGRDFELWVIGPEAAAPVSLGLVPEGEEITFEVAPEIAALIAGGVLALSDEPAGGSPTGAPTGAILATGAFVDV
ncbi:anti-sigma factor domain-containing protein [Cognatishimia sp. F0-27]|uniref:anti-sigma factor n=1 Tax=Cognatishimia sp. F0-27 TaxID=2816855 RepID=UPI001D0C0FFD|nr:anti-sigma factor [Cognatishimia sp. F0-27]MCC1491480.1 anti-sigma factor [Cognatishimia sp. F0-27]